VRERGAFNYLPTHLHLNLDIIDDLRAFQSAGFLLLVITNQSGVARGIYTERHVQHFHRLLAHQLQMRGVVIDGFFYCPHHPSISKCLCRKPAPGLLLKAMAIHGIDPAASLAFGDMDRDIEAARSAGIRRAFKVPSNPDSLRRYVAADHR